MFYVPNLPYAFYLAAKAKNAAFFSAANPSIKSSGNGTESKYKTIQLVPENHKPKSILHATNSPISETFKKLKEKGISFPLIAKPDVGCRGLLVQKINSTEELKSYLEKYPIDIIIQEFIAYENECGIFYHRNPNQEKGLISSITLKRFLSVIGDGKSTLKELIQQDSRAKLYLHLFSEIHSESINEILQKNKEIKLSAIGNHSKGTQFINGNHLICKDLESTFDTFCDEIPGFFYGRIDIKYNSFDDLKKGINFKILEINGIMAEPTHIYDAESYTYFKALKAIRTHWKFLFEIATTNHKEHEVPYKSSKKFIQEMVKLRAYTKKMKQLSEF